MIDWRWLVLAFTGGMLIGGFEVYRIFVRVLRKKGLWPS